MKKGFFTIVAFLCMLMPASAQKKMVVHFSDGTASFEKLVKNVSKITFEDIEPLSITDNTVHDITYTGATINFCVSGYYDSNTVVGVLYSDNEEDVENNTGNTKTGTVDNGNVVLELTELESNTTYYYKVYASNEYNSVASEISSFTTAEKRVAADIVDLGLSVKWASWNVGAQSDADYGQRYVWGDPDGTLTLNDNLLYLNNVGNDIGGTQYDIATVQWGKDWRIPTEAEWKELSNNCVVSEVVNYQGSNVRGLLFTARNGNSIFIPETGVITKTFEREPGSGYLFYWSSERDSKDVTSVKCANMGLYGVEISKGYYLTMMMPIRPVYVGN